MTASEIKLIIGSYEKLQGIAAKRVSAAVPKIHDKYVYVTSMSVCDKDIFGKEDVIIGYKYLNGNGGWGDGTLCLPLKVFIKSEKYIATYMHRLKKEAMP